MKNIKLFEVGGCVRDDLLGIPSKDVDFVVIAPSFEAMSNHIKEMGLNIFIEKPEYVTIRAGVPSGHPLRERCRDADFVLARKDGPSSDGRRPDFVEPGTLLDDLSRRDFTVNAMARDPFTGLIIDPFNGQIDLQNKVLRFVGDAQQRISEDGLRVLRGLRFCITKNLKPSTLTLEALRSELAIQMLQNVSVERIQIEVNKMLDHDALSAIQELHRFHAAVFRDGLRLTTTMKRVK